MKTENKGFTLIELLIVIVIIGVMSTIALFGIQTVQRAARDSKRKVDLENIKAALELFYSDCNNLPSPVAGKLPSTIDSSLSSTHPASCPSSPANVYLSDVPVDPDSTGFYYYTIPSTASYVLCTHLENEPDVVASGCQTNCGSGNCNYIVKGP